MIVDTSALLAVLFDEPGAARVSDLMNQHAADLCMSTVNVAETLILLRDRAPRLFPILERRILEAGIRFVAPDLEQAKIAAEARLRYPLNLGDCFAYALARTEGQPLLTLDRDFRKTDLEVLLPG